MYWFRFSESTAFSWFFFYSGFSQHVWFWLRYGSARKKLSAHSQTCHVDGCRSPWWCSYYYCNLSYCRYSLQQGCINEMRLSISCHEEAFRQWYRCQNQDAKHARLIGGIPLMSRALIFSVRQQNVDWSLLVLGNNWKYFLSGAQLL